MKIRSSKQQGFSLIELMIVVVIIGILGAIALPWYQNQVVASRRSDATASLLKLAQLQQKFFTECNAYAANLVTFLVGSDCLGRNLAWYDNGGLPVSEEGHYAIAILPHPAAGCAPDTCFILDANPVGPGASGIQLYKGGSDGSFRIDHTGRRSWDKDNTLATDLQTGRYDFAWTAKKN